MATMPTIWKGSDNEAAVKFCQERLSAKGYRLKADGDFGKKTDAAVRQFQAGMGFKVDGVVGTLTWTALMAEGEVATPVDLLQAQRAALVAKIPSDASAIVRKVLTIACNDLGKSEVNGSNDGPDIHRLVKHYNQYWWVFPHDSTRDAKIASAKARGWPSESEVVDPLAWCGMAVSNWIREGYELPYWNYKKYACPLEGHPFGTFHGGPTATEKWAKERGSWFAARKTEIMPAGATFTINRGKSGSDATTNPTAGHIGLVICDNGDGTVTTIEGNVSNKVGSHTRKKAELRGYATWW
jgi:hypothetical protein